ncbi:MAG: glycosyltransferase family 2 protein [Capsulimonadaceae bacterium]
MGDAPRISIVLCTYQGAAYLPDQLDSLARQSSLPAELVVADDASTDGTADIVRAFASRAPFEVRVAVNPANVGFIANFEIAITGARGDVIALCDQDDFWLPDKLARYEAAFASRPGLGVLFSDGEVVDKDLRPLGVRLFDYAAFDKRRQSRLRRGDGFDVLLDANVVTGATLAFRAELRSLVLPIPTETGRYHDSWIALLGSAASAIDFLPEPLIRYRQHDAQVTGVREHVRASVLDREHYRDHAEFLDRVDARLASVKPSEHLFDSRRRLAARLAHVRARASMPGARLPRLRPIAAELISGRYGRYSNGLRSVLRDIIGP